MASNVLQVVLGKEDRETVLDPDEVSLRIDGQSLGDLLRSDLRGLTVEELPPSGHFYGDAVEHMRLGKRVALLVCPLCLDIGCGALAACITVTDQHVIWSDFIHGNNYDPDADEPLDLKFVFDRPAYDEALTAAAARAAA